MATAPNGIDNLQGLLNLYSSARGSTSSSTSQSNISDAGVNQILQQILGGTNGLAAISSGQKSAGAYNSSTNQMLTNDLLSRTAGEVAKLKAGTTTTQTTPGKIGGKDLLMLAALAGGKSLLGPTINGIGKKFNVGDFGKNIADSLGVGEASGSGVVDSSGTNLFDSASPNDFVGSALSSLSDFGASFGGSLAIDDLTDAGLSQTASGAVGNGGDLGGLFSGLFGG